MVHGRRAAVASCPRARHVAPRSSLLVSTPPPPPPHLAGLVQRVRALQLVSSNVLRGGHCTGGGGESSKQTTRLIDCLVDRVPGSILQQPFIESAEVGAAALPGAPARRRSAARLHDAAPLAPGAPTGAADRALLAPLGQVVAAGGQLVGNVGGQARLGLLAGGTLGLLGAALGAAGLATAGWGRGGRRALWAQRCGHSS